MKKIILTGALLVLCVLAKSSVAARPYCLHYNEETGRCEMWGLRE